VETTYWRDDKDLDEFMTKQAEPEINQWAREWIRKNVLIREKSATYIAFNKEGDAVHCVGAPTVSDCDNGPPPVVITLMDYFQARQTVIIGLKAKGSFKLDDIVPKGTKASMVMLSFNGGASLEYIDEQAEVPSTLKYIQIDEQTYTLAHMLDVSTWTVFSFSEPFDVEDKHTIVVLLLKETIPELMMVAAQPGDGGGSGMVQPLPPFRAPARLQLRAPLAPPRLFC